MEDIKIRLAIDGAEQVQAGATRAAEGLNRLGQSGQRAGQQVQLSGQQMAQVSAQLQDLFVQIQGGQAPLTAILQQGSQLSAVFGGVGNAFRAVASLVSPTVAVLGTAAAAVGALALAYNEGANEAQAYTRALVLSGNAAGTTVGQLKALAAAQAQVVGTQSEAAAALAALTATGKVSASSLAGAAEAATRLAGVGIPLEETAKKFAALGKEPLKALVQLNEAENFLTESVYRQVKALESQGRMAEAAALAQSTYAQVGKQRSDEIVASLGTLERAWIGLQKEAAKAWNVMLNVGREEGPQQKLAAVEAQIRDAEAKIAAARNGGYANRPFIDAERVAKAQERLLAGLKDEAAALQENIRLAQRSADAKKAQTDATNALIKADEDAAKPAKAANAEREREAALLERVAGLTGSYQKDLAALYAQYQQRNLSEEQYVAAVLKLIETQPIVREQMQAQEAASKAAARALMEIIEAEQRRVDAIYKNAATAAQQVQQLEDEEKAVMLSAAANISLAEALERVAIARLEDARARAEAEGDHAGAAALRAEIDQLERKAALVARKAEREGLRKAADDARREWERTAGDIERSLTDALLRGFESGKDFARNLRDTLVNMFQTLVLKPIIQPVMASAAGTLSGLLGLPGNALAATGGGAGAGSGLSSVSSLLGLAGLSSAFSGGAMLALSGAGGTGLALQGAGALLGNGALAQGLAQGAGALAPWALGGAVGLYGGRAISNGFSAFGSSGNAAVNIGNIAGAIFGGPIGAAIGGAIGGLVNRAFGRGPKETRDTGLTGTASSEGFMGQAFADWFQKGGWFRSNKSGTDFSSISAEQDATLDAGIKALYDTTAAYAKVLGLPVEAVKGYSASFKVLWGKTEEENQKAIQDAFVGLGDQLAGRYASQLAPLQKAGETVSATLQRLAGLQVFSNSLNQLGGVFSRLAGASVDAREQMIALAGGMDSLSQQALAFAQNYYNRDEIAGLKARDVQSALSAAGITTEVSTREQFRALVESLDPSTATGRQQMAALLQLQGSFATVADYLSETGLSLSQAASQAPVTDALVSPLLSGVSQQLQLAQQSMEAQYETRDATLQVVQAVKDLAVAIVGGAGKSWTPSYREPEVQLAY